MINRSVVIIRPKQPYIDWAAQLDDSELLPDQEGERTIYLIPEYENDDHAWEILRDGFEEIFERELEGWHTDRGAWPQNLTFEMFKEWFDIALHSVVEDLCGYEIVDDEN